jgi:predicted nucleic acid-binding protein
VRFVDTNILLYAVSRDPQERHKAERARGVLAERDLALSTQVLQEFYVQATRESRLDPLTHEQAGGLVESFLRFPVVDITTQIVLAALATRQRFLISYWDAAILEAARALGCETVLSEDLSDGQDYAGVVVENPFSPSEAGDPYGTAVASASTAPPRAAAAPPSSRVRRWAR